MSFSIAELANISQEAYCQRGKAVFAEVDSELQW
jgi:hypothetical protein